MYFDKFPTIPYDSQGDGEVKDVTNLLKRVKTRTKIIENTSVFDTYDIKDGETPEMLAHRLYDDINKHWIILMFNNITDRFHGWPMSQTQFDEYIKDKYGNTSGSVHHYEIDEESGHSDAPLNKIDIGTDNTLYPAATAITNLVYEQNRQDELRKIKLLDPRYVDDFVSEFNKKIKETVI
jgi:hypothetical protein